MIDFVDEQIDEFDQLAQLAKRYPQLVVQHTATAENILNMARKVASDYNQEIYAINKNRGLPRLYKKPMPTIRMGKFVLDNQSRIHWRLANYISTSARPEGRKRKYNYSDIPTPKSGMYKETSFRKSFTTHPEEYMDATLRAEAKLFALREMLDSVKSSHRSLRKTVQSSLELAQLMNANMSEIKTLFGYSEEPEEVNDEPYVYQDDE